MIVTNNHRPADLYRNLGGQVASCNPLVGKSLSGKDTAESEVEERSSKPLREVKRREENESQGRVHTMATKERGGFINAIVRAYVCLHIYVCKLPPFASLLTSPRLPVSQ